MALSSVRVPSVSSLPSHSLRNSELASRMVKITKKEPRIHLKKPENFPSLSRRDTITLLSSSLLTTFLANETAEARSTKLENKRRAIEKLEKLREKAGKTKEKTESETNKTEKFAPNLLNGLPVPTVEVKLKPAISHPSCYSEGYFDPTELWLTGEAADENCSSLCLKNSTVGQLCE